MELNQTKAVITGGASGLGFAVASHLVQHGARVVLFDIDEQKGQAAIGQLGSGSAAFFKVDVGSEAQVNDALLLADKNLDGLNTVINCAGILGAGRVLTKEGNMPLSQFEAAIRVNLVGSFNVSKSAATLMQNNSPGEDGERGVIVNTASIAAYEGQIGQVAYAASKGGILGMTLPMAREFARIGIRVMAVAPGVFHTPMVEGMPSQVYDSLCAQVPYPSRLGKPVEFAQTVSFILTNRYLNGGVIRVDGAIRLQPK